MRKLLFILAAVMMAASAMANDSIYAVVEVAPEFEGGQAAMFKFIADNVVYPDSALAQNAQGKVYCEFVVEKDGSLSNIKVVRSAKNEWLDREAVRVITSMPNWKAGTMKGQAVRARYVIPVIFKIQTPPTRQPDEIIGEGADEEVLVLVEQMPEFPGGQAALFQFLSETVKYPVIAQENGIQGKCVVQFIVNKDGSITDVQILRSGGDPSLDKEAIRVIKAMPKWKPGIQKGKPVRVRYTVPVNFQLYTPSMPSATNRKATNAEKVLQEYLDKNFVFAPFKAGPEDVYRLDITIPLLVSIDSTGVIKPIFLRDEIRCTYKMVSGRTTQEVRQNGIVTKSSSVTFEDNEDIKRKLDDYCVEIKKALDEFIQTMNDAQIVCTPTRVNKQPISEIIPVRLYRDGLKKYKTKR